MQCIAVVVYYSQKVCYATVSLFLFADVFFVYFKSECLTAFAYLSFLMSAFH